MGSSIELAKRLIQILKEETESALVTAINSSDINLKDLITSLSLAIENYDTLNTAEIDTNDENAKRNNLEALIATADSIIPMLTPIYDWLKNNTYTTTINDSTIQNFISDYESKQFTVLPEELLVIIFSFCDVRTMTVLYATCRWLRKLLLDDALLGKFRNAASLEYDALINTQLPDPMTAYWGSSITSLLNGTHLYTGEQGIFSIDFKQPSQSKLVIPYPFPINPFTSRVSESVYQVSNEHFVVFYKFELVDNSDLPKFIEESVENLKITLAETKDLSQDELIHRALEDLAFLKDFNARYNLIACTYLIANFSKVSQFHLPEQHWSSKFHPFYTDRFIIRSASCMTVWNAITGKKLRTENLYEGEQESCFKIKLIPGTLKLIVFSTGDRSPYIWELNMEEDIISKLPLIEDRSEELFEPRVFLHSQNINPNITSDGRVMFHVHAGVGNFFMQNERTYKLLVVDPKQRKIKKTIVYPAVIDGKTLFNNILPPHQIELPNGYIAVASGNNSILVFDINQSGGDIEDEGMPLVARLEGHTAVIHSFLISPDQRFLYSMSNDMTIIIWELESFTQADIINIKDVFNNKEAIRRQNGRGKISMQFCGDGHLVVIDEDHDVKIFERPLRYPKPTADIEIQTIEKKPANRGEGIPLASPRNDATMSEIIVRNSALFHETDAQLGQEEAEEIVVDPSTENPEGNNTHGSKYSIVS